MKNARRCLLKDLTACEENKSGFASKQFSRTKTARGRLEGIAVDSTAASTTLTNLEGLMSSSPPRSMSPISWSPEKM